jgi:hypothetical protein
VRHAHEFGSDKRFADLDDDSTLVHGLGELSSRLGGLVEDA